MGGVVTYTMEVYSPLSPARAFNAFMVDAHNLLPKLLPHIFKDIEALQGDGGAGTTKQINFAQGTPSKSAKHRIDELDEKTCNYSYTVIESEALKGKLENVCHEIQLKPSPCGGTISTSTWKYYPLSDAVITEKEIMGGKDEGKGLFKVVEEYLVQNPDAYA